MIDLSFLVHPAYQYEKVMQFISTAKKEGATILSGGERPKVCTRESLYCSIIRFNVSCDSTIDLLNNGSTWKKVTLLSQQL